MFLSKKSKEFKLLEEFLIPFIPNVLIDIIGSYVRPRFFYLSNEIKKHEKEEHIFGIFPDLHYLQGTKLGYLIYDEEQLKFQLKQPKYIYEAYISDKILLSIKPLVFFNMVIMSYIVDEMNLSECYDSEDGNTYEILNIAKPKHYKIRNN
jgi:hypothetical protein